MSREAARIVAAGNKIPPQAERKAARTCKKLPVASFCASETAERMPLGAAEGFNWACAKPPLQRAESRFAEPRFSLRRERIVTFCGVQKVTKKHARTCKKLPVASFCASETAETGRIANGREQGDHVSRRRLRPATSIQIAGRYMIVVKVTGVHQVTGYAENCSFPGIAGNDLNRCEIRALQHKELERRSKE